MKKAISAIIISSAIISCISGCGSSGSSDKKSGNSVNEEHVEKIMQWIDENATLTANRNASVLSIQVETVLESIEEGQRKQYDGTYESDLPAEIVAELEDMDPVINEVKDYCVQIENGEVEACWVENDKATEETIALLSEYDFGWDEIGFTDNEALDEAKSRLKGTYYGSYPTSTISIYDESADDYPGYSNEKPDINNCME